MKKFFSLFVVALFALSAMAKQYCQETLVNGANSIQLSCELISAGNYRITVEGENLNGFGGSFFNPGATDLRTTITTSSSTKIVCDIASATAPQLYTPLYVMMPGEVAFGWPNDIEWGSCHTPVETEYNLVGDYNSWASNAGESDVKFYTTATEGTYVATAAEFTTGQWGFKVRKGNGYSEQYGSTNAISTGVAFSLAEANGEYNNIYVGQTNNNVTLHNVTFTLTVDGEGNATTLKIDADENINVADFHDRYIIVGTQTGWSFETGFIELVYQSEGVYVANVSRFQGDLKVVKNSSWSNAYSTATALGLGDNTLTKGVDANAALPSGFILKDAVLTLTVVDANNVTLNIAGSLSEEHSYGLVGTFQSWNVNEAAFFEEQVDGSWTLDLTDFPGNSAFKVSIDKSWYCFLADGAATALTSGTPYNCVKADNDNNFTIGETGKTYNAHFVLNVANDGNSAELTVTIHEGIYLEKNGHAVELLPVHYTGTNDYCLTIISDETMNGLGGSFWNVNGVGTDMRNSMTRVDANTLRFEVTSTTAPNIYTPLYVLMPGEVNFGSVSLVWKEAPAPTYVRTVTNGNYGTICLAKAATLEGATAYEIVGKTANSIVLNEVANLEAGVPYIFEATAGELVATLSGAPVAEAGSANGLIGSFAGCDVAEGMYVLANNTVKACGTGCTIAANRAYINLDEVPAATPAPEHRVIAIADVATALENANAENAQKMVVNGQLIIIKNGVRYNALGQVVK